MRLFLMLACWGLTITQVIAQSKDTVRGNYDYRRNASNFDNSSSKNPEAGYNHYLGLQANQLLSQLFDFNDNDAATNNPIVLTYSFNSINKGSGLSFGLGYRTDSKDDFDLGTKRNTKTSDIHFRFGFEKKTAFAKRWIIGRGVDILFNHAKDETDVSGGGGGGGSFEIKNKTNGWGFGPRMSVLFGISQSVYLGTEMSWYFKKQTTKTEFPGVPISESDLVEKSFNLQMPVAIFLTMRF